MSTSGSKSNEHVAHFLVDIHISAVAANGAEIYCQKCKTMYEIEIRDKQLHVKEIGEEYIANY